MSYIHQEIKKFWEDLGYNVDCDVLVGPGSAELDGYIYWTAEIPNETMREMIAITLGNGTNIYYFDGNKYAEQEALRIIKLKAFL
jgi:hypothetical protein